MPLSPGRAERHGFEYVRHGTLSLYAALERPTYASWLNQVELWFAKVKRDLLARDLHVSK